MGNTISAETIQVYDGSQTTTTQKFIDVLRRDSALGQVKPVTLTDISRGDPLLVLCHNYSRLGTDINEATSKLTEADVDYKRTAVVVLHSTAAHALPSLPPTETLGGQQYSQYRLLVDFFFSQGTGLHRCELNTKGWNKLNEFWMANTNPSPASTHWPCTTGILTVWRFCKTYKKECAITLVGLTLVTWYCYTRLNRKLPPPEVVDKLKDVISSPQLGTASTGPPGTSAGPKALPPPEVVDKMKDPDWVLGQPFGIGAPPPPEVVIVNFFKLLSYVDQMAKRTI